MEKEDWKTIAKTLRAMYTQPNFLADTQAVAVWYQMLKDLPTKKVQDAVLEYASTNKFPPTIADIREYATKGNDLQDWSVGWASVIKAISKYGYINEKEALESFDEITKKTVERIGWKNICMSEKIEVDRASFRIIYENIVKDITRNAQTSGVLRIDTNDIKRLSV